MFKLDSSLATHGCYRLLQELPAQSLEHKPLLTLLSTFVSQSCIKRKQLSRELVAAFVYQLARLAADTSNSATCEALAELLTKLLEAYPKCRVMLDPDNEGLGLNIFSAKVPNPVLANALHTSIHPFITRLRQHRISAKLLRTLVYK
jgi:hypothetical protein